MNRTRGFTLIELLIVVAIIAILAAIAIPSYQRYALRAHRADGQQLLQRMAAAEERFYATNNKYGTLADVGFTITTSDNSYYLADIPASAGTSNQAFTIEAVPQAGQAKDLCGTLTISNTGAKGPTSPASNSNGSCW